MVYANENQMLTVRFSVPWWQNYLESIAPIKNLNAQNVIFPCVNVNFAINVEQNTMHCKK